MDFGTKYGICIANTLDILQSYTKPLTHLSLVLYIYFSELGQH